MPVELLFDSDLIESFLCRAGQDGHAQNRHFPLSCRHRSANHFAATAQVNCQPFATEFCCRFGRASDGVWNVVQFEIEKNFCAGRVDRAHNFGTFGGIELQSDFEKRNLLAQLLDESKRLRFRGYIKRDDYLVSCLCHPSLLMSYRAKSRYLLLFLFYGAR